MTCKCTGGGWVPHPSPESRSWIMCECHPDLIAGREKMNTAVIAGLKIAQAAHPKINYAGFESSIAKRILGSIRSRDS